jgi:hypothetical protein
VQDGDQQQQLLQPLAGGVLAPKQRLKFTKFSNAYMLVYVRLSDWQRFMAPVAKDGIAPYLLERLEVRYAHVLLFIWQVAHITGCCCPIRHLCLSQQAGFLSIVDMCVREALAILLLLSHVCPNEMMHTK